jgi:hypothetical protein
VIAFGEPEWAPKPFPSDTFKSLGKSSSMGFNVDVIFSSPLPSLATTCQGLPSHSFWRDGKRRLGRLEHFQVFRPKS